MNPAPAGFNKQRLHVDDRGTTAVYVTHQAVVCLLNHLLAVAAELMLEDM